MIMQHHLRFSAQTSACRWVFLLLSILGLALGFGKCATANNANITIVTDIAPVHSLVSMVAGQQAAIELLVPQSQSPHSFTLKPSQIRSINEAKLIIILSDDFTPSLGRHLKSINSNAVLLELSNTGSSHEHNETDNTQKSDSSDAAHDKDASDTAHSEDKAHSKPASDAAHSTNTTALAHDPHTWLDPNNAIDWIDRIAVALSTVDEQNHERYEHNAMLAINSLTELQHSLRTQLADVGSATYIVYHDAYRHFAKSYDLSEPIAIALSDARAPGAAKLRAIRAEIIKADCVFSEVLHDDAIVDMVSESTSIRRGILDPIGSELQIGPMLYPQLMQVMANSFVSCLQP